MAIWNLGSINADLFYAVPHLPAPGETLASTGFKRGLGGKGANISVAAARAAARVHHIGAVGPDGAWAVERLLEYGVDTRSIAMSDEATGHAIILTDAEGENEIILHGGANRSLEYASVASAIAAAASGDWFVCQNETNLQKQSAELAKQLGQKIAYIAAPFDPYAVEAVLPQLDLLILNAVEASQFEQALGWEVASLSVEHVIVTKGADGCAWYKAGQELHRLILMIF